MKNALAQIAQIFTVPRDNPELLRAQSTVLTRLIPLLYLILLVNAWVMAVHFMGRAPDALTIYGTAALTLVCVIRLVTWWRLREVTMTTEQIHQEFQRTIRVSMVMCVAAPGWALSLFPYGDEAAQYYVALFLVLSLVSAMFCLIHLRAAAVLYACVSGPIIAAYFVLTAKFSFVAIAVNCVFVMGALLIVVFIENRYFERMVNAQTEARRADDRIRQLAHYDVLTGLPNRFTFRETLTKSVAAAGSRMALFYIDLDGFKVVNDTRGHPVGDVLLGQVAGRLRAACDDPAVTVGRLGGDEFAVLAPCDSADAAMEIAAGIIEALGAPFDLDHDKNIRLGASVGFALAPEHGEDPDILLSRADMALYAAKAAGKRQARAFSADMETRVQDRVRLEEKLRAALDDEDGLFVFYQPIVDIETGKVTAREALVRWHHPQRGWISPGEFVPVAEQSGLIDQLGRFVLDRACRDALERHDGARVAVNISAVQLGKGTLPPTVLSALVNSGLSPNRLEIEVTETALLGAETASINELRRLRDMGVRVALDDFGTGYSSLSHLQMFPFDKIKIDGSFVKNAVSRPESAAVVRAVADLGKRLGVTTVAEGVETHEQLSRIRDEGCTEVQGYLYGRPAPTERDAAIISEMTRAERKIA